MCKIGGAGRLYDIANEHFMTVKEVAALLRVEKTTIYRWIENGKLNAKKISKKKILVPKQSVLSLMESGKTGGYKCGNDKSRK